MKRLFALALLFASSLAVAGINSPPGGAVTCLTAGSASIGCISYNGTTQSAGKFDSGAVAPVHTNLLNYDGNFAATILQGGGGFFRTLVGNATYGGLYPAGTPTATNYSIMSNGTSTYVNGGGNTYLAVAGTPIVTVSSTGASVTGTFGVSGQVTSNAKNVLSVNDIQAGQACISITVGASPFAYTATYGGDVTVGGGVVTAMTKTRATVVVWNTTLANDDIPVRAGDILTVSYTTAPVMYQCSN